MEISNPPPTSLLIVVPFFINGKFSALHRKGGDVDVDEELEEGVKDEEVSVGLVEVGIGYDPPPSQLFALLTLSYFHLFLLIPEHLLGLKFIDDR